MVEAGEMLEHAEVFDNRYGTPRAPVEAALAAGRDVLFDVDWQGGQQLRASALSDKLVMIFLLPPSIDAAPLQERDVVAVFRVDANLEVDVAGADVGG